MERRKTYLKQIVLAFALTLTTGFVTACEFCHGILRCEQFAGFPDMPGAPISQLTSSNRTPVFEDDGTIIVYRGMGCAESNKSGTQQGVVVEEH